MIRPQSRRLHARQVVSRQAHPAHEVHFDHPRPLVVPDLLERARLEDAQIVDQDRDVGEPRDRQLGALRRAEVGGERLELRPTRMRAGDGGDGVADTRLGTGR